MVDNKIFSPQQLEQLWANHLKGTSRAKLSRRPLASQNIKPKEVVTPRNQVNVQSRLSHLITEPVISFTGKLIEQVPSFSLYLRPWDLNVPLSRTVTEVDDDEVAFVILDPAPTE
jgi:hypothetical protein